MRITDATKLVEGDIVQNGQGVHTFIIVSVRRATTTTATSTVVDSNHYTPTYSETVSRYTRTFSLKFDRACVPDGQRQPTDWAAVAVGRAATP